jgi:hypothetical protein
MTRLPTGRESAGNEWADYPRKLIDVPSLRRVLTLVQRRMTTFIVCCPMTDSAAEGDVRPNFEAGFHFHPTTHDRVHIQYSYLTAELASETDVDAPA